MTQLLTGEEVGFLREPGPHQKWGEEQNRVVHVPVKTQSVSLGSRPSPKLSTATAKARAKWASARKEPSEELTRLALALGALSSDAEPQPLAREPSLGVGVGQGRGVHSKLVPCDPTSPPTRPTSASPEAGGRLM